MLKPATSWAFRTQYNVLIIDFVEDGDHHEYDIGPVGVLADTLYGENRSQIIFHIDEKSWSTLDMLYDIAFQIVKYNPDHRIDWVKTFTDIELSEECDRIFQKDSSTTPTDEDESVPAGFFTEKLIGKIEYMEAIDQEKYEETKYRVKLKLETMHII